MVKLRRLIYSSLINQPSGEDGILSLNYKKKLSSVAFNNVENVSSKSKQHIHQNKVTSPSLNLAVLHVKHIWTTPTVLKDRKQLLNEEEGEDFASRFMGAKTGDENILKARGESLIGFKEGNIIFPTLETHQMLVNGVPFCELQVVFIYASRQNTLMTATEGDCATTITSMTAGSIGYKNMGKRSTVAAQTLGYAMGKKLKREGIKNVRVVVKGIGNGRYPSMLGMKLAGMNIVSISDRTQDTTTRRPRAKPSK